MTPEKIEEVLEKIVSVVDSLVDELPSVDGWPHPAKYALRSQISEIYKLLHENEPE